MYEVNISYPRPMDDVSVDDLSDFFGAMLEVGHSIEDACDGVLALAAGVFEPITPPGSVRLGGQHDCSFDLSNDDDFPAREAGSDSRY
jgi:hypothetical protein